MWRSRSGAGASNDFKVESSTFHFKENIYKKYIYEYLKVSDSIALTTLFFSLMKKAKKANKSIIKKRKKKPVIKQKMKCHCNKMVFLDKDLLDKMQKSLGLEKEFGGSLIADAAGKLHVEHSSFGEKRNIDVPISEINFHTHPNLCYNRNNCSLGVPSANDMVQIYNAHHMGNRYHVVFSHEGVYVICVDRLKIPVSSVREYFEKIQKTFDPDTMNYEDFVKKWMGKAENAGFDLTLHNYEKNIYFVYKC